MNMGAAMAPAALTVLQNFEDLNVDETFYDRIITGRSWENRRHDFLPDDA